MISDRDLARQILERDFINLYKALPSIASNLGLNISPFIGLVENKILGYADMGIEYILNTLFGADKSCDVDEATDIAKMFATDKIEEYRKRVHEMRDSNKQ